MLHSFYDVVRNSEDSSEEHPVSCRFKVESEPSKLGINGGRITMALIRVDGKVVCRYTKLGGFIVMPEASDPVAICVVEYLLRNYN